MTGAQALDILMSRLGSRTDAALRAALLLEINYKMRELERMPFLPWFLQDEDSTVVTTANVEYASVPADFLRFDDDWGGVFYQDTAISGPDQWVELTRTPYPTMKQKHSEDEAGNTPQLFDIIRQRIYLRPIPDGVYTLRFLGYFADTAIADDETTNQWLTEGFDWLLAETGFKVASLQMQHAELAKVFAAELQRAQKRVSDETTARKMDAYMPQMGDD